jgi:hypothetical protein
VTPVSELIIATSALPNGKRTYSFTAKSLKEKRNRNGIPVPLSLSLSISLPRR